MRALWLVLLVGCVPDTTLISVEIEGSITGPAGTRHVVVHHAEEGTGRTAHPLGPIASTESDVDSFSIAFDYPADAGTGLVVYAWADLDGDGVHCAVGVDDEPAGLVELEPVGTTPGFVYSVELDLTAPCAGPESLYP